MLKSASMRILFKSPSIARPHPARQNSRLFRQDETKLSLRRSFSRCARPIERQITMNCIATGIHRRGIVLGGKSFGAAGAYEKIAGTIRFAADPDHPLHRSITDIALAPRNR